MDRTSRSELLKIVKEQEEKLTKYQTKLRDILAAYKSVLKEKEALESSLQVLSTSGSSNETRPRKSSKEDAITDANAQSPDKSEEHVQSQEEAKTMKDKLTTLTSTLATLTQEKSKMEANYQAEKKLLRQEYEEKINLLEEEQNEIQANLDASEKQLSELKNRLRLQQHERDREQANQGLMLKELQQLLAAERIMKEQYENQIEELKFELDEQKQINLVSQDQNECVKDLNQQIKSLRAELSQKEKQIVKDCSESTHDLEDMKQQLEQLRLQHDQLLTQEQEKASMAEKQLKQFSGSSEGRISQLEAKISQLSSVIGDYERRRVQDEQLVVKLKENIHQLEVENLALAQTSQVQQQTSADCKDVDLPHVMGQFIDDLANLRKVCQHSDRSMYDILNEFGLYELSEDLHSKCKHDVQEIKEEFERYKLRAQSVLKSKSTKDPVNKEIEALKLQLSEYKEKMWQLRAEKDEDETLHREKQESLSKTLSAVQEKHQEQLSHQESEFKLKVAELDQEMKRQRERTIALLAEKDNELNTLRNRLEDNPFSTIYGRNTSPTYRHTPPLRLPSTTDQESGASCEQQHTAVTELLSRSTLLNSAPVETSLLHFAEEQARKEVEIQSLHRQKHSIESALRDLQHSTMLKEQHLAEQVDFLKEEIRKYQRNVSRENANLEYLKNVVYHFMVSSDTISKQQMVNAIATILQFSPKEKNAALEQISTSWFSKKT